MRSKHKHARLESLLRIRKDDSDGTKMASNGGPKLIENKVQIESDRASDRAKRGSERVSRGELSCSLLYATYWLYFN